MRADAALSDVVGAVLLLAVTVAAAGVAALALRPDAEESSPPRLALGARVEPGTGRVHLAHAGGDSFDAARLAYVATVNGTQPARGTLASAGAAFAPGARALVVVPGAGAGSRIQLDVLAPDGSRVLAGLTLTVPAPAQAAAAPPGFTMDLTVAPGVLMPPALLQVEARVAHPEGRKLVAGVVADLSAFNGVGAQPLRDDGVTPDRVAGDAVWTGHALALPGLANGPRTLTVTATDAHGAAVVRTRQVLVQETLPTFNASILRHAGFWIAKYPGHTPGDLVTTHLKVQVSAAPVAAYGTTYRIAGASLRYLNYLPSQPTLDLPLAQSCAQTHGDDDVRVFSAHNATLNAWMKDRDTLRFYYTVRFERASGASTAPLWFDEIISPHDTELYFLLRREIQQLEVKDDDGWSTAVRDCAING